MLYWSLGILLLLTGSVGAQMRIALYEPALGPGDRLRHDRFDLLVRGEVIADLEVEKILLNGELVAGRSRDLEIEELSVEGTPFEGRLVLRAGDNPVEVVARAADGSEAVLRFTVEVETVGLDGAAFALIVGIDDYADARIADLRFAEADARLVRNALTHPEYGVVPPENVRLLTGREATYRNISVALEEHLVRRAQRPQDVVFFYFAGHGAEGPHVTRGAAYYLVPHDADLRNLLSTAIEKGRLQFLWGAVGAARKVFITDACHSGGLQDMRVLTAAGFEAVEGFITLAAARADQRSWELPRLGHGIFTHVLHQGLAGAADREVGDGDGLVEAGELGLYLERQVRVLAAEIGAEQSPVVELGSAAGEMVLGTKAGQALPPWSPPVPAVQATSGPLRVELRFGRQERRPRVIVVLRDEDGAAQGGRVAATAAMQRLLEAGDAFSLIEPEAVEQVLGKGQVELAFSAATADIAAVARAVEADLIISGSVRSTASSAAAQELLGSAVQSFQAHISARAVYAATGEVAYALNVQQPGLHIEAEMARRQALEKAGAALADQLMGPMLEGWSQWRRGRPDGQLTVENAHSLDLLHRLEDGLAAFAPVLRQLEWRSFAAGKGVYEFDAEGGPAAVAQQLREKGLAGFRMGPVEVRGRRLWFAAEPRWDQRQGRQGGD